MMNLSDPKIILKKDGTIDVETATIAIHDASFTDLNGETDELLERMNEGKLFCFCTGGDGSFNVQFRVVDGTEAILSKEEYTNGVVKSIAKPGFINLVTGSVVITDFVSDQEVWATVEPGLYQVNVFSAYFSEEQEEYDYFIVLAHANTTSGSNYQKIESLIAF
jgi:hypothetical protein